MVDRFGRIIDYARVSVTDRCNLRCVYCRPEKGAEPREAPLSLDRIRRLCAALAGLGISRIKITGGEPLLRGDIADILRAVRRLKGVEKVSLTTNGVLLARRLADLPLAELDGLNISLDSLDAAAYGAVTRGGRLADVLTGLDAVLGRDGPPVKINCVALEDLGEDAQADVAGLARDRPVTVRFIEVMPVGPGRRHHLVPRARVAAGLERRFGPLSPCPGRFGSGPADYYTLPGFRGKIGFISALSHKFCDRCNRVRVTSGGYLKTCLHFRGGLDLRPLLTPRVPAAELAGRLERAILEKPSGHRFDGGLDGLEAEPGLMSRIGG